MDEREARLRLGRDPAEAEAWVALGLARLGAAPAEALRRAARAARIAPREPRALLLLGRAERALGRPGLAWLPLEAAAEALPGSPEPRVELAAALLDLRRYGEAAAALAEALAMPGCPGEAHALMASALYRLHLTGRGEEARGRAAAWARAHPANPLARHSLASLGEAGAPPPDPGPDWVRLTFDRLAEGFDGHLAGLGYRVPQDLCGMLARHLAAGPARGGAAEVVDLGCGTGLCGPHLRPLARRLVGVDLSPGMLAEARAKGIYDALVEAEVVRFLEAAPDAWDAAVAADLLIYLGEAGPLVRAAARALRPGGLLALSIEATGDEGPDGRGWALDASGRYRHAPGPLARLLAGSGLAPVAVEETAIRMEMGAPIPGRLVLARRAG